ncbi:MAG: hypothetical protein U9O98_05940 [Asgard group archaeon]|nr:hypothetical protein [Asgard group archaeon]
MSEKESEKKIKIETDSDEIPVEDIRKLLQMVNKEIPDLIKGLFSSLYSIDTAKNYGEGIATIYQTLEEKGLPKEMIEKLVMKYADSINLIGNAMQKIDFDKKKEEEEE